MEVVVRPGAIRRAKLQSSRQHQQTNTQLFTGRMPLLSNSVRTLKDKLSENVIKRNAAFAKLANKDQSV